MARSLHSRFFMSSDTERAAVARAPRDVLAQDFHDSVRTPHLHLKGLSPTAGELAARNIATVLLVPAVMLIVWWVVGSGFQASVPVEREADGAPQSEVGP